ncbi:helix-turn-helix domain-containing protein [Glutamicibacter mysorens]
MQLETVAERDGADFRQGKPGNFQTVSATLSDFSTVAGQGSGERRSLRRADCNHLPGETPDELLGRCLGDQFSASDEDQLVCNLLHFAHQVAGNENRSSLRGPVLHELADPSDAFGIQSVHWLVQDEDLRVAEGAVALSPRIAKRVINKLRGTGASAASLAQARISSLSSREHDVLALVGAGLSNAEIAGRLFLTDATVKGHMTSIMLKVGARNRVEAALNACRGGAVN